MEAPTASRGGAGEASDGDSAAACYFFLPDAKAGLTAAVKGEAAAVTFGFDCFGFLCSRLPRF